MKLYEKSIKPILFGSILSVLLFIVVSKIFWWIILKLNTPNGTNASFLETHPTITVLMIRFGLYVMPFLFAFLGGYIAHALSEKSGLLHSIIVGFIGSLFIFGNVFFSGSNLVYPSIYIFYGICWTPVSGLGGIINKLIQKFSVNNGAISVDT